MKTFVSLIVVSTALSAVTAAHAQTSVGAQNAYRMSSDELGAFQGQYLLDNGATLSVSRKSRRLYSAIEGQPEEELVATSPNAFVTRTGAMEVTFRQAANGNVSGVALRYRN